MPTTEPFLLFTDPLESAGLRYMVSGSVAAMYFGEPRLTNDVDIVLWLAPNQIEQLSKLFPLKKFYCPPPEVLQTEATRPAHGHCNLIHHGTGFKADLYFVSDDPFHLWGLANTRLVDLEGHRFKIAPPEYVIGRKLQFYREGKSQKHLRDIGRILESLNDDLDFEVIKDFVQTHSLQDEWIECRQSND